MLSLLAGIGLAACSDTVAGGGGGIETGNALAVTVVDSARRPVRSQVRILPREYRAPASDTSLPAFGQILSTDDSGRLTTFLPAGEYRLEVLGKGYGAWQVASVGRMPVDLGTLELQRRGALSGVALLPEGCRRAWIRLMGRPGGIWTDSAGRYTVPDLPAGAVEVEALFEGPGKVGGAQTVVPEGGSRSLDLALPLDPAATGRTDTVWLDAKAAGVANAVDGFPLLLRLDSSWFSFAGTTRNGGDIRVAWRDQVLPMEVERWDSSAGKADVWVRLDVPLRDSIPLVLHRSVSGGSISRGSSVFRAVDGYQGVWHLGASLRDAVDGTVVSGAGLQSVDGVAGSGALFSSDSASAAKFAWAGARRSLQVDAWVLTESVGLRYDALVSAGPNGPRLHRSGDQAGACFSMPGTVPGDTVGSLGACSARPLADGAVHLVSGTWENDTLSLWLDGVREAVQPLKVPVLDAMPVFLGRHPNGLGAFTGILDEVRIQTTVRSPDWLRLQWATQRPGATAVRHGR